MAAAPVADGRDNGAEGKARTVVVESEIVNVVNDLPQGTVPARGDSVVTSGSLGGSFADDDARFSEYEDGDSTECSSSFDGSYWTSDDELEPDAGAMEVDSMFQSHINTADATVVPHMVKNRKVTADWRKYIGPVMWRCQWLELRMKDLVSQVAKYDKELAIINHEKDLQLEMMKGDCPKLGLLQLDLQSHERNTMKRRKRKRDEDVMDSSLSTEKHLILSYYYEKQKKKTETDELLDDDDVNSSGVENMNSSLGLHDILAWLESNDNDVVLEQNSLRDIILSIDETQSRIINIQNNLSKAPDTMDHGPKTKRTRKKKKLHSILQNDAGSVDISKPDEELTVGMLFGTDNPLSGAGLRELYKESADDILIDNQAAREEGYWQFERVNQNAEKHLELVKNVDEISSLEEEKNSALVDHGSVSIPAPIVTLINKRGPKPKKKHNTKRKKAKEDTVNSNVEETMLIAVDTLRSQRVRKPKLHQ